MNPSFNEGMQSLEYWRVVFEEKNLRGGRIHTNMAKGIGVLLSLPFANALIERHLSQLSFIKSKQRASLKHESLLALLQAKHTSKTQAPARLQIRSYRRDVIPP